MSEHTELLLWKIACLTILALNVAAQIFNAINRYLQEEIDRLKRSHHDRTE